MIDALAAEWLKIRSVRSTWYILAVVAVGVAGLCLLAWYAAGAWDRLAPQDRGHASVTPLEPIAAFIAQLALAVLGTLAISTEYGTGMVRISLAAMPNRRSFLMAKASTVAAIAFLVGLASVTATSLITRAIIGHRSIRDFSAPAAHRPAEILALSLSIAVIALTALSLAAITRSAVAALATVTALLYVLPIIALHLPSPWGSRLSSLLPTTLPNELASTVLPGPSIPSPLPPWAALLALISYAAIPLTTATLTLHHRDA